MLNTKLLGERYRFLEKDNWSVNIKPEMRQACELFLKEIHQKNKYVAIYRCPYCGSDDLIKISEVEGRMLPSDIVLCGSCDGCFKSRVMNDEASRYYYENLSYVIRGKNLSNE